jgi:hypothetical protein
MSVDNEDIYSITQQQMEEPKLEQELEGSEINDSTISKKKMKKDTTKDLKSTLSSSYSFTTDKSDCPICLEKKSGNLKVLSCGHTLHKGCYANQIAGNLNDCSICRKAIIDIDAGLPPPSARIEELGNLRDTSFSMSPINPHVSLSEPNLLLESNHVPSESNRIPYRKQDVLKWICLKLSGIVFMMGSFAGFLWNFVTMIKVCIVIERCTIEGGIICIVESDICNPTTSNDTDLVTLCYYDRCNEVVLVSAPPTRWVTSITLMVFFVITLIFSVVLFRYRTR